MDSATCSKTVMSSNYAGLDDGFDVSKQANALNLCEVIPAPMIPAPVSVFTDRSEIIGVRMPAGEQSVVD